MTAIARVLVTGASRGIGRAIAVRLSGDSHVVAVVRRSEDARALADQTEGRVTSLVLDLADRAARARLIADAERSFGPIDALVYAAGLGEHRPLEAVDHAQIDRHLELNVIAGFDLARALAASLCARRAAGSILFLGSTLAERPAPTTSVYAMTKGAIAALTRALALELAPQRIRVNAIAPGVIDTEMIRARGDQVIEELAKLHPIGRVGTPDEVAEAAAYLLRAEFATGTILTLDGGLSL